MEQRPDLVLKNVSTADGHTGDISIREGHVLRCGATGPTEKMLDCTGLFVLPAAVDVHVHMRGGPQSAKEDWESGSRSALAGGVTVVVDQPNTIPPLTTPEAFSERVCDAQAHSWCSFAINSAVTPDTPLDTMWKAGAMAFGETFFAPSSYGEVLSPADLSRALERIRAFGGLATIHAESVVPGEDTDLLAHDTLRSTLCEREAVHAVQACNTAGCRIHFCHMSSARSIDAAAGSVEVTPHHLFLSCDGASPADTHLKVNPPVRSEKERKELWSRWNRIDMIASDHAPHTLKEKSGPFSRAPSGIPGVETMVPLLMAEVLEKRISLVDLIHKTSKAPATLIGIPPAGFRPGDRADFAIYPKKSRVIAAEDLHSRCGWTPFEGHRAVFPQIVIMNGEVVYDDGEFTRGSPVWYPGKGYQSAPGAGNSQAIR
ncbi:MAG: dihydroorotase [Methanoregula sp.]|jgi:dihydroorotase